MSTATATAKTGYVSSNEKSGDPYHYQVGFGNNFTSEAIPGVLPIGQNSPQRCKYDLYAEQLTGTPFTSPRVQNKKIWFYRIRPSVSHDGFTLGAQNEHLVSDFSVSNANIHVNPTQIGWLPFEPPKPDSKVDFVDGIKTIGGTGGAVAHEGVASHIYLANSSMEKKAFVNSDGDLLVIPELGRLDIQTELGRLFVQPGEIAVIQSGLKFRVELPDGPSRGYIQEIYGAHFELPELGPLGANGLANVRDFEHPVASFDLDQSAWEVVYKIGGKFFVCKQDHTPFDVVAWHGNYVPYKYALEKFIAPGSVTKDHLDPSTFCVLTAKSKIPGVPLLDFCVIGPRWDVATQTFRPPYYHRNCATELIGFIKGTLPARPESWQPGGINYQTNFCPHGVTTAEFDVTSQMELTPMVIAEGILLFLLETPNMLMFTDFAIKSKNFTEQDVAMWQGLKSNFLSHVDEVNADLKAAGLPQLVN